jgi:hypothetical protein
VTDPVRVVLVRPWVDAQAGGGCCSGDTRAAIALDHPVCGVLGADAEAHLVGRTYRLLRERLPGVDVQVVSVSNTAYLVPSAYRAARRRSGRWQALRAATRATTAGAVLVDGERIGDVEELGPEGVLAAVRGRLPSALS